MTLPDLASLSPRRPSLYRLAADGRTLDFLFAQCPACHELTFPANAQGCMHCGQALEQAERIAQPGGGTLLEYVTLHAPLVPGIVVPSIAGDIRIADNVVREGVIGVSDEALLTQGMLLRAVAVPLPSGEHYGCQFVPAAEVDA